jgi:predicted AAA+ superfamily ATPase
MSYQRPAHLQLQARLQEPPGRLQIVAGPRQVGKTTLVRQLMATRPSLSGLLVSTDAPGDLASDEWALPGATDSNATLFAADRPADRAWLIEQWRRATAAAQAWRQSSHPAAQDLPFVLAIDEIQKIPQWSETIKGLWDRQMAGDLPIHLALLGSAPLLTQKGLTESLAGRYELLRMGHWSYNEMNVAFSLSLDEFVYFGGFPGSVSYVREQPRWRDYVNWSLIHPNIERDILQMTRIDKPALLKQLFELGCAYSGQILSLDKILGQLNDAGNVTTLSRYLDLLGNAGLLRGLQKYSEHALRQRKSPPKFQVLNNALMSAPGSHSFEEAQADRTHWGRLVESAVGAHLCNEAGADTRIHYWREGALEVDFVVEHRGRLAAIEVKSGKTAGAKRGLDEFAARHPGCRTWVIGSAALPLGEFLRYPPEHWVI